MRRRIGFLVFPGVTLLDVSGPAEVFSAAGGEYEVVYLSAAGGEVATSTGIEIAGTLPVREVADLDTLVVPGSDDLCEKPLDQALLEAARVMVPRADRVASVCTGAFVLAELGLLDGRCAATHWRQAEELARRYPLVKVEADTIHVRDGRFLSSAGISAGIDLALAVVEDDLGPEAARRVARELVVFMQRPGGQRQFSVSAQRRGEEHELLAPVIRDIRADPAGHTVASMAEAASLSVRHLHRLFLSELGSTPGRWLESVRLDKASSLLLAGCSVTKAAKRSGFGSDETLRRAFVRHFGSTPTQYRARFATTRGSAADSFR